MNPGEQLIVDLVRAALPDVVAVYLFGSRTRPQDLRADSDWDIAVLAAGGGVPPMTWFDLKMGLTRALNVVRVDLVDLKRSNYVIRETVLTDGELLYDGDEVARLRWEYASEKLMAEWRPAYEESSRAVMRRLDEFAA